jgi:hypothetical protein
LGTGTGIYLTRIALKTSVANPDHFDADPDPTSEKPDADPDPDPTSEKTGYGYGSGSDHALYKIL